MHLYLFIFESIGTQELILIGIVALVFLGPRKLPEMARKIGKVMADFRNTTNEFKSTWEREVNFEEEERALKELALEEVPREKNSDPDKTIAAPAIKSIDKEDFEKVRSEQTEMESDEKSSEKRNWL